METSLHFSSITEESLKYSILREEDIIILRKLKSTLVRSQLYSEAAVLREIEKQILLILEGMAKHGYKPKPMPSVEEKVYTINDVNVMLSLATSPLKKTIEHYEELSRNAIVEHVAGLMKINDELRKNQKSSPEAAPYVITGSKPLSMKCEHDGCERLEGRDYKRKERGHWSGEPIFLCDEHNTGYEPSST